jgi:hypothetical protein
VVGRVERAAQSASTVPGLRVQFDPMPDETVDRLQQLLRDLGLQPEEPAAAAAPPLDPSPALVPPPAHVPGFTPVPMRAPTPVPAVIHEFAPARNTSPPGSAPPPVSPSAPFGSPFLPSEMQQITWAPPEGLEATKTMSMEAVRSALEAGERLPPEGKAPVQPQSEMAQAALAPPPIMPVPSGAAASGPPGPKGEGEGAGDPRLMVQIRGLLMELGDVQTKLDVRERESEDLGSELVRLRRENQELRQKLEKIEEQLRVRDLKDRDERF